ncbi:hypothetical protein K9M74_04270 [Candidatus Woesearchaeota archaeon]|nr:hypothetical protein [Candidatus Woesearchaeota archaeon]
MYSMQDVVDYSLMKNSEYDNVLKTYWQNSWIIPATIFGSYVGSKIHAAVQHYRNKNK